MTTTTYVITPADAADRMSATSYPSREAAAAAASASDYVVAGPGDVLWTGHTLVDVYNALTGSRLKKFESRDVGVRRLMQALPVVATPSTQREDPMDEQERETKQQEREAAKATKQQEREAAKAAKQQEREAAKATKQQEREAAKAAKRQEREAAKATKAANGARRRYPDDALIELCVSENPKTHGAAAERFKLYRSGMTVRQALDVGILRADLSWDSRKGFIAVA